LDSAKGQRAKHIGCLTIKGMGEKFKREDIEDCA